MDLDNDVPAYVARPLQFKPFRSAALAPSRVGDPNSARNLARPYRDVAQRLNNWIDRGWASRDDHDGLHVHEYTAAGLTIRGLVGALDMSKRTAGLNDRAVWPHEAVHPEQAGDLAWRMEKLRLNPAPILLAYEGNPEIREVIAEMTSNAPDRSFIDRAEQKHRIWALRDAQSLNRVRQALAHSDCIIADGHHRYAAYLAMQNKHPGTDWDFGLAMLVDQSDTPLHLGPIHRCLNNVTMTELIAAATTLGATITRHARSEALNALSSQTLIATDADSWFSLTRPPTPTNHAIVEWLHTTLLPQLNAATEISYHHDVHDTLARTGSDRTGLLLPSLTFAQVRSIVASGRLLPEKATSFQPKPSLGAIMRPIDH